MKKRFTTALAAAALLCYQPIRAQIQLGVKAGINSATVHIPSIEPGVSTKSRIDFQGGFIVDMPVTRSFSLQPAVLFSSKGSRVHALLIDGNTGSTISGIKNSIKLNYAEIPVLALFKRRLGQTCQLYGGVGPYVGLGLGGTITSSLASIAEHNVVFGSGSPGSNTFRRWDYGVSAAAGVELGQFQIGVNYGYGLVDLGSAINRAYNRVLGVTAGFWLSKR